MKSFAHSFMNLAALKTLLLLAICVNVGCTSSARKTIALRADRIDEIIVDSDARIDHPEVQNYLNSIAEDLLEGLIDIDDPFNVENNTSKQLEKWNIYERYDVHLVNSAVSNASTVGKDFAILHTRLLLECPKAEYLAAILAHELGHICKEHSVREDVRLQRTTGVVFAAAMLGAAAQAQSNAYASTYGYQPAYPQTEWGSWFVNVMSLYSPFNKKDEHEADLKGLEIYIASGFNPEEYQNTFEWMLSVNDDVESASHPKLSLRLEKVKEAVLNTGSSEVDSVLDGVEFERVKELVREYLISDIRNSKFVEFEKVLSSNSKKDVRIYSCVINELEPDSAHDEYISLIYK